VLLFKHGLGRDVDTNAESTSMSMTMKTSTIPTMLMTAVVTLAMAATGCQQILGIDDPVSERDTADSGQGKDATPDTPGNEPIDGQTNGQTDGSIDGPIDPVPDGPIDAQLDGTIDGPSPKLWVFVTKALLQANFGGRTGADGRCLELVNVDPVLKQLGCTNVHAVLQVNDTDDRLASMASKFNIPNNAPVLRPADSAIVNNTWDDLINANIVRRSPVVNTGVDTLFWSGKGVVNNKLCTSWTTNSNGIEGDSGNANRDSKSWLSAGGIQTCGAQLRLLCVCW